jgi:hypothetical protein
VIRCADSNRTHFAVDWDNKHYWFTPRTLQKFEALRGAIAHLTLEDSPEKAAVLLSLSLAVRICSRADQRSPKPFISKQAVAARRGRHVDPRKVVSETFEELCTYYGRSSAVASATQFCIADLRSEDALSALSKQARIITSPPYLNAQDYFRNFKLELHMLEGLLPFKIENIKAQFIGTERALRRASQSLFQPNGLDERLPVLKRIQHKSPHNADVVRRYFSDMARALQTTCAMLEEDGVLVVVCGDNRIANEHIQTWKVIATLLQDSHMLLFDSFADPIKDRLLAPQRLGHMGLIKEEVVMAFRKKAPTPP